MVNRKKDKTVHIPEELHNTIQLYKVETGKESIEKSVVDLIKAGFQYKKEELPDYIIEKLQIDKTVKRKKGKEVQLSDLDKSIVDLSEELEGGKVGSDETIRNITLSCLRYLKNHQEATHNDFKEEVYPKYQEDFKEDSFWKVAKSGLKQIEELSDLVETPEGRGHYTYKWKG